MQRRNTIRCNNHAVYDVDANGNQFTLFINIKIKRFH